MALIRLMPGIVCRRRDVSPSPGDRVDPLFHGVDPAGQMHDLAQQLATDTPRERRKIRAFILQDSTEAWELPLGATYPNSYRCDPMR